VLEALPRNPTGKIMRRELVKLLAATPEAAAKG
jgi:acyl-coenzyme A synthetase/AMP-(fatty) acid ligase